MYVYVKFIYRFMWIRLGFHIGLNEEHGGGI